ncbi:phage repressor protein [Streptobacillus moniliformis]|uniref:Prophage antirepressor n=1 Tax=Streptobacillus moniliformis (strain ATCC 14647 / DSM 12112 / NCTC 10651 / 9901) TaxID=519441 RepID=D1AV91_STRM9|nr:phage repressor protein [Streptobacillus moniliformis]ACZ01651.1 prophage antirepressor [Streptobacillus moniliformis DSM 12112]AVL43349.1 phage repressor protein [Streptobacillus moniliformis]QXW66325.1 phage repressor protein [Streptobacillus moniliformis]SQA13171.1 BRO family, N-terminal domain [Streptobacillus moniliformis]
MDILEKKEILGVELVIFGNEVSPMFNANEIAKIIENKNVSQMLKDVEEDEKELVIVTRGDGKTHKQWYLTEDGLYEVLFSSRKPIAKKFKKQVKEILKTIRQKSGYIVVRKEDNEITIKQRIDNLMKEACERLEKLQTKLIEYEEFFDEGKEYISLNFLANKYEKTTEELIKILTEKRFIYQRGKTIYLYREHKYKNYAKYFKIKGKNVLKFTLKGESFIDSLIKKEK